MWKISSSSDVAFALVQAAAAAVSITLLLSFSIVQARYNLTQPITHRKEVQAFNIIFEKWGILTEQKNWTIGSDPCSGKALGASPSINDMNFNPFIKCNCTDRNGTICHITALKVFAKNVVGGIPDELWTLTYLTNLNLAQNYLTGTLSASIGNLTRMLYLTVGSNSLSGKLPKELGLLTDLRTLGLGTNKFSGPLPSELGNLTKLEQIYFDSSGINGGVPSTFANLRNMVVLWASDNELTGRIPDFIGNWSKLQNLFEGNSFDGPIPSTFSNLSSLIELRISDLTNGSSSLSFIKNMKSLTTLVLRNDNIFGSIPSNIYEYVNLTLLDLSFNNITGDIPDSLFNMESLLYLFLGNNSITGTLPDTKSSQLSDIDVSYNYLGGSIPLWIIDAKLQINLVANKFTNLVDGRFSLPELDCVQRSFPCNQGRPIYSQFAINCGGSQFISSDGIVYESDMESIGSAAYFVTNIKRWGISNVGRFTGSSNPDYKAFSSSQITNTSDSSLFQTARLSASSLRYYGFGLENGNYTVTLQFAETVIPNGKTWQSLGRRVFDIYIQGSRALKDFDIQKAAGGVSNRAVQRKFTVQVSENYLEIHLFWAGKGTCCIPHQGIYGPSISAISAFPDFIPTVGNKSPISKKNRHILGIVVVIFLVVFVVFFIIRRKKKQKRKSTCDDEDLRGMDVKAYTFSYTELKTATEDFDPNNKLGEGGFGKVFKGKLDDGRMIAVKQLSVKSQQGKSQFVNEIATISAVQHRNLVELYGCCVEGDEQLLVYEFLENNSLDQALFGVRSLNLDWPKRCEICLGVARGLAYLHEESRLRIVHRDVKASNILLDSDLIPKISDFGLAKLYDDKKTHISTRVAGTIGYLAREYALRGHLTEKADVYAFGVVALEIVSGRPNSDSSLGEEKIYLIDWAWQLFENNHEVELVDPRLSEFREEEVKRVIRIALLCTQFSPVHRPSMTRVVAMLRGDAEVSSVTMRPGYFADWIFDDVTERVCISEDNTTRGTDEITQYNSSTSVSTDNQLHSPQCETKPILN